MGAFIVCCTLIFSFFNFNTNFENNIPNPFSFIKSIFNRNPFPTQAKKSQSYTIALVGDSMTEFLGSATELRDDLKKYYPSKEFGILNFGIGSSSILSLPDRLTKESKRGEETLPPILGTKPDILLLESFGNNPLSQFSLKEGLKKQNKALDQTLKIIKEKNPNTVVIFVATISPFRERYGEGVVNLSTEKRRKWADERIAYIKNHIKYAKEHNIPLINIYSDSLNDKGDGNVDYINSNDFIHPSPTGILFIDQKIADFIFKNKILSF